MSESNKKKVKHEWKALYRIQIMAIVYSPRRLFRSFIEGIQKPQTQPEASGPSSSQEGRPLASRPSNHELNAIIRANTEAILSKAPDFWTQPHEDSERPMYYGLER